MKKFWAIITILTLFIGVDFSGKVMKADEVWARAAPAGAPAAMVFVKLENKTSASDVLVNVLTNVAENASIHEEVNNNGVIEDHVIEKLPVTAGETKVLKPHGVYILLTGLKKALVVGDSFPISFNFDKAGLIDKKVHIEQMTATLYDNF